MAQEGDVNKEVMNCESNRARRGMSEFESEREGATMQTQTELSKDAKVTTNWYIHLCKRRQNYVQLA